jgi:F-type H+-transporting ATPase subunit b
MAEGTTTTTAVPHKHEGGFPPFDTTTFPSQIFWLVITFGFLFVVLWRVAGPRINAVITTRRNQINADIAAAQKGRSEAEAAQVAYQTALAGARARANTLAEESRKVINSEIEKARHDADAMAAAEIDKAESRIAASRGEARTHVANAARDAAVAIVARLTGETVTADEAAAAVRTATGG